MTNDIKIRINGDGSIFPKRKIEPSPFIQPDRAYYNTGSCVHPRCITGIEITPGKDGKPALTLIKWGYATQGAGRALGIEREELMGVRSLN